MKQINEKVSFMQDDEYQKWLLELMTRYEHSRYTAVIYVNRQLIHFFWSLGRDIANMKSEKRLGKGFYNTLSKDLIKKYQSSISFSPTNLQAMCQFYELFPEYEISQQLADQFGSVPWGDILVLLKKVGKNKEKVLFYLKELIEQGWSQSTLESQIDSNLYEQQHEKGDNHGQVR